MVHDQRVSALRAITLRFVVLAAAAVMSVLAGLAVGAVSLSPLEILHGLAGGDQATIVRDVRLPRVLLAALAGGGLAAAGAAYQGLFRNPLADPFIIGSSSGAALGATVVLLVGFTAGGFGLSAVPAGAFVGSLTATAIVYATAALGRGFELTRLLLAGAAVGSALNALAWVLLTLSDKSLMFIVNTLLGSFSGRGWAELSAVAPWMTAGLFGLFLLSRPLDALAAGDGVARGLGLNVPGAVAGVMTAAGVIVAAAVAAGGVIGFVGLVAPYVARAVVGHRHLAVLPASTLIGVSLLVIADTFARSAVAPGELPVGVVTALIAAPFFLVVIARGRS
jgi:iron complex transport system permease protein